MSRYDVKWQMFGIATVEADGAAEAEQIVVDGCMGWTGDIDWEENMVDGAEIDSAEAAL